jgi:hypothetical protein
MTTGRGGALQKKAFVRQFFYVRRGQRSYFELRSSVFKLTYITYVRQVADEHKAPRPPHRPARLGSSANVSA